MKINHVSFYSKQNRLVTVMYIMANVVQFSTKHPRPSFYLHTPSGWPEELICHINWHIMTVKANIRVRMYEGQISNG